MADIDQYLEAIKNAVYGRDVRDAIHDGIEAINDEVEDFVQGDMDTTLTSATLPAQGKAAGDAIRAVDALAKAGFAECATKVTVYPGYYTKETGRYHADSTYRCFKVACTDFPPFVYGTDVQPARYILMYGGSFVTQFTPGNIPSPMPAFDEIRINYHTDTFETGDITVYTPGHMRDLMQYPERINADYIQTMGWTSVEDMPEGYIYQMGSTLPASFGLAVPEINSVLIILQATRRTEYTWGRMYINQYAGQVYVKVRNTGWTPILVQADIDELYYRVGKAETDIVTIGQALDVKGINVLFVGNSFTQDEVGYVPALIKEAFPTLECNFGILFKGAATLEEHLQRVTDSTKTYAMYHEYSWAESKWVTTQDVSLATALAAHSWDVVCFQQGLASSFEPETYQPYLNQLIDGYTAMLGHNVRFAFNFAHVAGSEDPRLEGWGYTSDTMYAAVASVMQSVVLGQSAVAEVIPSATATQNARTTSLASLGTTGDMCADTSSHLQAGACCLPAAYVIFAKVCEWLGKPYKGFFGSQVLPTSAWATAQECKNWMHGTPEGATAANALIAAKCAAMALKAPFVKTDCSEL